MFLFKPYRCRDTWALMDLWWWLLNSMFRRTAKKITIFSIACHLWSKNCDDQPRQRTSKTESVSMPYSHRMRMLCKFYNMSLDKDKAYVHDDVMEKSVSRCQLHLLGVQIELLEWNQQCTYFLGQCISKGYIFYCFRYTIAKSQDKTQFQLCHYFCHYVAMHTEHIDSELLVTSTCRIECWRKCREANT